MSRLPTNPRDALPADQRRFYDAVQAIRRRPVSGPFIVTMNSSPDLAARFAHLGHYFHSRGQADESILPLRVRAFVALIGSRALDAPYEWGAWVNWALESGASRDTVDAIREHRTPQSLTDEEVLLGDFCAQLLSGNHRLSEATFGAALARYGAQGIVELAVTLGYFAMIGLPLNGFEAEITAEQKSQRKPFTPLIVGGSPYTASPSEQRSLPPIVGGASAPRLPPLARHDDVAPEHQHFLDRIVRTRGRISGIFQVLLHAPDAAERVANVGAFILYETVLPPAVKTLTWLIGARELDCNYVWNAAVSEARAAKVDDSVIVALEHGRPPTGLAAEQQVLFDFCRQLLRGNHHVDDATYRAVITQFGIPAAVQIAATLGYVVMMCLVANAIEVPPAGDDAGPAL